MTIPFRLDEDWHVHSTFSDGADTLESNIRESEAIGLQRLGCVDHVRIDTTYVPDYVAAVVAVRPLTALTLTIGIEAKILDRAGTLDMPADVTGVDLVYVADHQFPGDEGPLSPRVIREALAAGTMTPDGAIEQLASATIATMRRYSGYHKLVLAHLFSIVPKLGLSEEQIGDTIIRDIVSAAYDTGTIIELSERWKCPGPRVAAACEAQGVHLVASTDSHRSRDIGKYEFVRTVAGA